jgi:hypothetical protein
MGLLPGRQTYVFNAAGALQYSTCGTFEAAIRLVQLCVAGIGVCRQLQQCGKPRAPTLQ